MSSMDREALEAVAGAYVSAVLDQDPSQLPLAANVRFTENSQEIHLGEGVWCTSSREPAPRRAVCFVDVLKQQVAVLMMLAEHGEQSLLAVRLAFNGGRQITEIEQLVARSRNNLSSLFNPDGVDGERAHFKEQLAPSEQASRDELIAAANAYFDGIEANDGSHIPVVDSCLRFENGMRTVRREVTGEGFAGGLGGGQLGVAAAISSGRYDYITAVRDRRFLCDEERGLVLALAFFDHLGKLTSVNVKGVGEVELPPVARRPSSTQVFEVFKVADGKIVAIEAFLDFFQYGTKSGWPVESGTVPSLAAR